MLPIALLTPPFALAASSSLQPAAQRYARHRDVSLTISPRNEQRSSTQRTLPVDTSSVPLGGFKVVGNSGVSAQMMFSGTANTVYILDKSENNSMQVSTTDGLTHPAWGTPYDLLTNEATPMSVSSNTFCAGGFSLANGSWVVFGGNQPVTYGGVAVYNDTSGDPTQSNPYDDPDGGAAIQMLIPCDNGSCTWQEGGDVLTMHQSKRWYPTIEGLADGSVLVLGGDTNGGYVSTFAQNNPSYEYWPKQTSGKIDMAFLNYTVPVNLFPLTWLTKSGRLLDHPVRHGHANRDALPDMPYAQRVYPASAAAVMLPLTAENNYNPTILFCGGSSVNLTNSTDGGAGCTESGSRLTAYSIGMGTARYGSEHFSIGQSYGQDPVYMPAIYDPSAPAGSRFNRTGLSASPHERMYHSTAILLADGSILVSGSNPNADVETVQWATSYVVEKWYLLWYSETRPNATGWPESLSYGGDMWNLTYQTDSSSDPGNSKVVVIRTGFSTHCMNFGQGYLELNTSYALDNSTGEVTLHVSQMPPNANIFQPGPAMLFLVVDGILATGQMVIIGSGNIETQKMNPMTVLPTSSVFVGTSNSTTSSPSASTSAKSAAHARPALPSLTPASFIAIGLATFLLA